ncbi:hypothetical protein BC629DRAFT_1447079 [Irpex lacteus]|nr:hypothetical protein BC629DRAFT_1447079 [Irpex lacteus]
MSTPLMLSGAQSDFVGLQAENVRKSKQITVTDGEKRTPEYFDLTGALAKFPYMVYVGWDLYLLFCPFATKNVHSRNNTSTSSYEFASKDTCEISGSLHNTRQPVVTFSSCILSWRTLLFRACSGQPFNALQRRKNTNITAIAIAPSSIIGAMRYIFQMFYVGIG